MWSWWSLVGLAPVDVAFDTRPPPDSIPGDQRIEMVATIAQVGLPDLVVPSSFPPVTCEVRNGFAQVWFSATRATWPDAWPSTVTCDHGPLSWTIALRDCGSEACRRRDRDASAPLPSCDAPWFEDQASPEGPPDAMFTEGCALPRDGRGFLAPAGDGHEWPALRRQGAAADPATDPVAPGVTCAVSGPEDAAQIVVVTVDRARIAPGTYCPLRRTDGSWATTELTPAR